VHEMGGHAVDAVKGPGRLLDLSMFSDPPLPYEVPRAARKKTKQRKHQGDATRKTRKLQKKKKQAVGGVARPGGQGRERGGSRGLAGAGAHPHGNSRDRRREKQGRRFCEPRKDPKQTKTKQNKGDG